MADSQDQPLERDELVFLTGSVFVDGVTARVKGRAPRLPFGRLLGLVRTARSGQPLTRAEFAALGSMDCVEIERDFIRRFDITMKGQSRRYNVGLALLSARTLAGGLLGANIAILGSRLERPSAPAKRLARPLSRKMKVRAPQSAMALDPWDDPADYVPFDPADSDEFHATEIDATAGPAPKASSLLDPWDDAAAMPIDPADMDSVAAPVGRKQPSALVISLRQNVIEWLSSLGYHNSGVRIEDHAVRLVDPLSREELEKILAMSNRAEHLRALELLGELQPKLNERVGAGLYLSRLTAVLRCARQTYKLPVRRPTPEYEPVPGAAFYLIHMRDPFETNGYVSRTHLILSSIRASGRSPLAITRLGFPNDLGRHRRAAIAGEEMVEGTRMLSLPDIRDGQLGRPVDDYIDAYAERVVELAREHRPTVIHAASNYMNGLAAIKAARVLGIPAVYEVRGIWEITQASANAGYAETLRYELQRKLENEAVRAADHVVVISNPLRRFVIEHGAHPARVSVVPNGVDVAHMRPIPRDEKVMQRLGIARNDVVIGYVGSVVRYEGIDYIIRAVDLLKKRGVRNFRFLLVGDGRELAALKALAAQLKVDDLCIFAGRVSRAEVEGLYSVVDIVPLPRRSLAVTELVPPLKPFEAMAAGKAVVVSSVEAIADTVIDGETGTIVEKDNVEALAAALKKLIEDPELRHAFGARSREWVQRERSVDSLARQLDAVYDSLGAKAAG